MQINGQSHVVDVPSQMPLLWALCDDLGMATMSPRSSASFGGRPGHVTAAQICAQREGKPTPDKPVS